jgi:hypothetical protein
MNTFKNMMNTKTLYLVYYLASHMGKMMPLFCTLNLNATFNLDLNLASTFKPKP